jgi:hypothetical protein
MARLLLQRKKHAESQGGSTNGWILVEQKDALPLIRRYDWYSISGAIFTQHCYQWSNEVCYAGKSKNTGINETQGVGPLFWRFRWVGTRCTGKMTEKGDTQ